MRDLHLPETFSIWLAYGLFVIAVIYLITFSFAQGKDIVKGFKGKDGLWQFIEVVAYAWVVLFTVAGLADIFLGFHASRDFWASMDAIFIVLVTGKVGITHFGKESKKDKEDEG